jgi:hypothetical protein
MSSHFRFRRLTFHVVAYRGTVAPAVSATVAAC